MGRWSKVELGRLRMLLERGRGKSIFTMARENAHLFPKRSVNAISHKLRELESKQEFTDDTITLEGDSFPASVVSGYIIITVDSKRVPAHHWLWRKHYGKIPRGYHIHHRNGNRLDNRINNLALMDVADHIALHNKSKPPETFILFSYLQEKGLWEEYLLYREDVTSLVEELRAGTKKP